MRFKSLAFCFLFFAGCARVPDSDLARVFEPASLELSSERALAREFFAEGGWPTDRWWEMFEDPQLNALIEQGLQESPTLQKALARVEEMEQEARIAKASLFPSLDMVYTENWEYLSKNGFDRSFFPVPPGVQIPHTVDQIDLTLNFNYEIDFFGRNRNRFEAALGRARSQRAEAKQATLILTTLIAQTYIELQIKLAQQEVLREQWEERNALFELTAARNAGGIEMVIPVLGEEQNVYAIEQSLITIDKEIALDKHMLSVLIGAGPDTEIISKPMSALFERPFPLPADLSSDLLARRPDLAAQIWQVEAAAKEIGAAKADFYPRVNLLAFAGLESLSFNKLFKFSSRQGGLDPALHLPIFTGGALTAALREKVAAFNEATYAYNELVLTAAREVSDQIAKMTAAFDSLMRQVRTLEASREQLMLQNMRYQNGVDNFLAVLQQEETIYVQRYQLYGIQRDYLLAVLMLIKALGGGYVGGVT